MENQTIFVKGIDTAMKIHSKVDKSELAYEQRLLKKLSKKQRKDYEISKQKYN